MSINDFFNTIRFLITVEPDNYQTLILNSNSKEFDINQVSQFLNFVIRLRISLQMLKNILLDFRPNFAIEKKYCHQ